MTSIKKIWGYWDRFWFAPVDLYRVSLFRMLLGISGFLFYLPRHFGLEEFYGNQGIFPLDTLMTFDAGKNLSPLFWFPQDFALAEGLHVVFLLSLLLLACGMGGRLMALLAFVLHFMFLQRNYTIMYGADKVITFWLMYMVLARNNDYWRWGPKFLFSKSQKMSTDIFTPVAVRLMQLQVCIVYGFSGLEKLKGGSWWAGTALWNIFSNGNFMPFDMSFIAHFPLVVVLITYLTLIFEIYFPMAIWIENLRKPWLIFGFLMHLGIGALMGLFSFSLLMIISYVFFLKESEIKSLGKAVLSLRTARG